MIVGSVAVRCPEQIGLQPPPVQKFEETCQLFSRAAETSARAARGLVSHAFNHATRCDTTLMNSVFVACSSCYARTDSSKMATSTIPERCTPRIINLGRTARGALPLRWSYTPSHVQTINTEKLEITTNQRPHTRWKRLSAFLSTTSPPPFPACIFVKRSDSDNLDAVVCWPISDRPI